MRAHADELGHEFCFDGFEEELAKLPGEYGPPCGRLLLATNESGETLGCVALRPFADSDCEMKRMYVVRKARGKGVGRALAAAILEAGTERGYRRMLLDTLARLTPAIELYKSVGFIECPPYNANPMDDLVFLARPLQ